MKKFSLILLIIIVLCSVAIMSLSYDKTPEPSAYYNVYLNGELLGKIKSKEALENYINKEQREIKQLYSVADVYIPNGLEIKKGIGYDTDLNQIDEIYGIIKKKSDFTIKGYQISIKKENSLKKIYVLDKEIFQNAIESVIKSYVGTEKYEAYKNNTQEEVKETGSYITDIYIDNDITIKEINIPSTEKIYTDSTELSKYLLFGENNKQKSHIVKSGDTIEDIAYEYKISTEEFLMSNSKYKSKSSILSIGDEVIIGITDPQINVTVSQETTEDLEEIYKTIEKVDTTMTAGSEYVQQSGKNGIIRQKQNEKVVNGTIVYVQQISKDVIRPATDKVIVKGTKIVSSSGNLNNWLWPVDSYKITSDYSYRINPFNSSRELHGALDIAAPYGSKISASNNGVIQTMGRTASAGIYVVINHNNGYYTQYNHMSAYAKGLKVGQTVERGQVIGYVGMTGAATGPHLHFAVWYGGTAYRGTRVNPWTLFR